LISFIHIQLSMCRRNYFCAKKWWR